MPLDIEHYHTVPQLIQARAIETPNLPAWHIQTNEANEPVSWKTISWQTYLNAILTVAQFLIEQRVNKDDTIAIAAPNSLAWEVAEKAVLFIGATIVGIDINSPTNHQTHIIDHASTSVLIAHNESMINKIMDSCASKPKLTLTIEKIEQLINQPSSPNTELPLPDPDRIATMIYTSGSTGTPKAIPYSQRQYLMTAQAILDSKLPSIITGKGVDQTCICWLPLSNLFQRVVNTMCIAWGAQSYIINDPKQIIETIKQTNPTLLIGVPRFYEKLYDAFMKKLNTLPPIACWFIVKSQKIQSDMARYYEQQLTPPLTYRVMSAITKRLILNPIKSMLFGKRIETLITGSAPTPIHALNFFESITIPLLEAYGQSENIIPIAMNRKNHYRKGSVGKPLLYHDVIIGENGEILVKGPGVFTGYYHPDLHHTSTTPFNDDHYLQTGDIGYTDKDGYLYLTGRCNDLIKTSTGHRIFPRHNEEKLSAIAGCDNAVIIGNHRKHLSAILALCPQSADMPIKIIQHEVSNINKTLPKKERIYAVLVITKGFSVDAGHLTPNQKIKRKNIEHMYLNDLDSLYAQISTTPANNNDDATTPIIIHKL